MISQTFLWAFFDFVYLTVFKYFHKTLYVDTVYIKISIITTSWRLNTASELIWGMSECQLISVSIYYLFVLIYIGALKDTLDLKLVGPFEILAGAHKISKSPQPNFHLHWRYFYDPPEFQTILLGSDASQHHIGYYRYRTHNLFPCLWCVEYEFSQLPLL